MPKNLPNVHGPTLKSKANKMRKMKSTKLDFLLSMTRRIKEVKEEKNGYGSNQLDSRTNADSIGV